jgi:hypothetical protein
MDTGYLALNELEACNQLEWIAWMPIPLADIDFERNQTEQILVYWVTAFQPSNEKTSSNINGETERSSFDRLRDLERSWREAARDLALIQENLTSDLRWRITNTTESDSPNKIK